jgi:hypothetical protein
MCGYCAHECCAFSAAEGGGMIDERRRLEIGLQCDLVALARRLPRLSMQDVIEVNAKLLATVRPHLRPVIGTVLAEAAREIAGERGIDVTIQPGIWRN